MSDLYSSLSNLIQLARAFDNYRNQMGELNGHTTGNTLFQNSIFHTSLLHNLSTHSQQPNSIDPLHSVLQSSLYDNKSQVKKVISDEGKEQIDKVIYKCGQYDISECPISTNDFKEGDEISRLPCGHIFESESILHWLENMNSVCPICRYELPSKEITITSESENHTIQQDISGAVDVSNNNENMTYQHYVHYVPYRPLMQNTILSNVNSYSYSNYIDLLVNRTIENEDDIILQQAILASIDISSNHNSNHMNNTDGD